MRRMIALVSAVFVLGAVFAGLALAQSFLGSINGTVKDSSGALIPEAGVTLTEASTGIQRTTKSNTVGNYYFGDLPPGTYKVAVSKEGFKEARGSNIVLTADQAARFDAVLEVGNVSQSVEVKALAPTLDTENGQVSGVLSNGELNILPLNNRSTVDFMMLNSNNYQGDGSSYSLGGIRGNDTNFTIDGVSSNSAVFGAQVGPMTQETFDSVGELKSLVSNNSAEYPAVGTLMIATKSGTNVWHGDAFDLERNWVLDARSPFSSHKPHGPVNHDVGADIGGPVVIPHVYDGHNKTFFHFVYEGVWCPGSFTSTAEVPTPLMQQGNFSELLPANGATPAGSICAANSSFCSVIMDPTTGQPFSSNGQANVIPPNRISQEALNFQSFGFVPPNILSQFPNGFDWVGILPSSCHDTRWVVRVDHQAGTHDSLSFRSSIRQIPEPLQFFGSVPQFYFNESRSTQNVFLGWTHSFSPTVLNEFRVGFSRDGANLADSHADGRRHHPGARTPGHRLFQTRGIGRLSAGELRQFFRLELRSAHLFLADPDLGVPRQSQLCQGQA